MSITNWFQRFKKPKYDLTFNDIHGETWNHYPPVRAKDLRPLKEHQLKVQDEYKFVHCPGMHDYSRMGYIIPAWVPFHIKANKAGTAVIAGSRAHRGPGKAANTVFDPKPMDFSIAEGTFTPNGVNKAVSICPSPWKIKAIPGVSMIVTAPYFHNKIFVDNLFVYPGVVDYDGFHTVNFVFSVRGECDITINQGDPLIHVIPIFSTKEFNASYKPVDGSEKIALMNVKNFFDKNFYRRHYLNKKVFNITPELNPNDFGGKKTGK